MSALGSPPRSGIAYAEWLACSLRDTRELLSGRAHRRMRALRVLFGNVCNAKEFNDQVEDGLRVSVLRVDNLLDLVREGRTDMIRDVDLVRLSTTLSRLHHLAERTGRQIEQIQVPE